MVPLQLSKLPGRQGIHRAELHAVVDIMENFSRCRIWSDSQVTVDAFHSIQIASSPQEFMRNTNYDKLLRMFHAKMPQQRISKIKARQELDHSLPDDELYLRLGNAVANDEAIKVTKTSFTNITSDQQKYFEELQTQKKQLELVYRYMLDLQMTSAKTKSLPEGSVVEPVMVQAGTSPMELFSSWQPVNVWPRPQTCDTSALRECAWGEQVARATYEFLRVCEWPMPSDGPGPLAPGITWTEMALAISYTMKAFLPIRRVSADGNQYVLWVADFQDVERYDVTMTEQAQAAQQVVTQVMALVPQTLIPDPTRSLVRSMYMQGETFQRNGLKIRPKVSTSDLGSGTGEEIFRQWTKTSRLWICQSFTE